MKKALKKIPTSEKLAKALEAAHDSKLSDMIKRARQGYYDDYNTSIQFPIIQLVRDLEAAGYPEIAERARNGEWDAQRWEAREWFQNEGKRLLRSEWPGKKRGGADTI